MTRKEALEKCYKIANQKIREGFTVSVGTLERPNLSIKMAICQWEDQINCEHQINVEDEFFYFD